MYEVQIQRTYDNVKKIRTGKLSVEGNEESTF